MALVMKQTGRTEEAIEAIRSFRHLCTKQAQESLDNVLIDLYKKCGLLNEQIVLYKQKLRAIYQGEAFNGRTTRTTRSHGKKFQVSIEQETARILGNLGWAYMQQGKYDAAEMVYRKVLQVRPDGNMVCNLGHCVVKRGRYEDAYHILDDVVKGKFWELAFDEGRKAVSRAEEMMRAIEVMRREREIVERIELGVSEIGSPLRTRRLPIF